MSEFLRSDLLVDLTVHDQVGEKVGKVSQVYTGDTSGRAEWITVNTGLFGLKETFVPLEGARVSGDDLHVPFTKEHIKNAARIDADDGAHLDAGEEQTLYAHYGLTDRARPADGGPDRSAANGDAEMVRSEERLRVGTERSAVGTARLKKVVVTEHVTTTIPVSHEEVCVVREPVRPGEAPHADIAEEQTEVTLHAERPVVGKEKVAVERVRLETAEVTEEREIHDTVRKEEIEYENDTARGSRER